MKGALAGICDPRALRRVVITDKPALYRDYYIPDDWKDAADYRAGFKRHSATTFRWPLGEICPNAPMVSQEAIDAEFAKDPRIPHGWEGFHAEFQAKGLNAYSRPAYSRDGRRAAILVDSHCDVMCGMGLLIELERTERGWIVVRAVGTWIS